MFLQYQTKDFELVIAMGNKKNVKEFPGIITCFSDISPGPSTRENLGLISCELVCWVFLSFKPWKTLLKFLNIFFFIDDLPRTLEQGCVGNSLEKEATFYINLPRCLLLSSAFFSKHHPESKKESPMISSIQYISGALFATTAIANLRSGQI